MVNPSVFITVSPVVTLVRSFRSLASFTFSAPFSDTTPILPLDNLDASAPPLISNCSPNFLLMTVASSPLKLKPLAMVLLIFVISVLLVFTPSLTVFSWSSVAACPCTTVGLSISHVRLVNSFTVPAPVTLTVPAWISPVVPSMVTLFPAVILPVVPSTTTFLSASAPRVTLSPNPTVNSLPPAPLTPSVTVTLVSFALTVVAFAVPPIAAFS